MRRSQNKPRKFSKPGSQYDRAVVGMSSGDASRFVQRNLGIFDSFRLLSIKSGRGFPKNVVRHHMLLIQPFYEAVIVAGEGHFCFWTNLTQMN